MNNDNLGFVPTAPEMQQKPLKQPKKLLNATLGKIKTARFKQKYLAFPYGLLTVLFVIIPLIVMFVAAFRGKDGSFTIHNFDKFWAEGQDTINLWKRIWDTVLLAFLTTVCCLAVSYPLSLALCKIKINKRAVLIMLFVAPMWINSLLRLFAIKLLFGGMENKFILMLIGMVYDFFPFMMLPVYTSISNTDKSYIEAAGDLGASPLRTLIKVKLPLSLPGIISGSIMVFMPAMSSFAVSTVLSDNTFVLFGNMIANRVQYGTADGVGAAYSLVLLILMGIIFFVSTRFSKINSSRGEGVL